MTIVDALKELFVKFGGNETDFDAETVSQALDQISDIAESGGGGYDGKIRIIYDDYSEVPSTECLLESGTYDSILNALYTKKYANIIVYVQIEDVSGDLVFYYNPSSVHTSMYLDDPCIVVSFTSEGRDPLYVAILPDNTVVFGD